MAQILDRVTAAQYGVGAVVTLSSEAQVVVDLNNAAMYCGKGRFFYLPEPAQAAPTVNPNGLHIHSAVPNLIYLPHQWSQNEKQIYLQLPIGGRFFSIQAQLPRLNLEDVVPINLVMHPRGDLKTRYNLSWPTRSLATMVILCSTGRIQIASMAAWASAASISADGNTFTIEFWRKIKTQQKYHDTADAIGKKLEVNGILAEIEKKVPPFSGPEGVDGTMRWAMIKVKLAHEAGNTAVAAALPTRPIPPPTPRKESTRQPQAHPVPGPDGKHKPLISPSTIFIQSQLAAKESSDDHYDAKVNTSPTKKRRVTSIFKNEAPEPLGNGPAFGDALEDKNATEMGKKGNDTRDTAVDNQDDTASVILIIDDDTENEG